MAVLSQQQDIESKRLCRLVGVGGRLREELASSGHDGSSGFGVTELIDVGVKKDLVRADVVLLKGRCVRMVLVSEALGLPIAVDRSVGGRSRQNETRAAGAA
jgi:hypothetical protein